MAREKSWDAIPPQPFTANGTSDGLVTIADALDFHVQQKVFIQANSLPDLELKVKRVLSSTTLVVGPLGSGIDNVSDVSSYVIANGAYIRAVAQSRPSIPEKELIRAAFAEEPAVAHRVLAVDELGNPISSANPLPVAFDGTVTIGDVSIVQGGNTLTVNADGSTNVNVISSPDAVPGIEAIYNSILSVASGIPTTLLTFTATGTGAKIYQIDVSGDNIATYTVNINGAPVSVKRTYFGGNLNTSFQFQPLTNGLTLTTGQVCTVIVSHNRPFNGNFDVTLTKLDL